MNLPEQLQKLLHPKTKARKVYLSLALTPRVVRASGWIMNNAAITVLASAMRRVTTDNWDDTINACDSAISQLENDIGDADMHDVVLAFDRSFLTESGDIEKSVRPNIKRLTTMLELTPLGFVPITSAIIFGLKKKEGVPPSVILVDAGQKSLSVTLVRVGNVVGTQTVENPEFTPPELERVLKVMPEADVLPSRILLFGTDEDRLADIKTKFLAYPWPSHANFMHYPKIEILPGDDVGLFSAQAGASELASELTQEEEPDLPEAPVSTSFAQPAPTADSEATVTHHGHEVLVEDEEEEKETDGELQETPAEPVAESGTEPAENVDNVHVVDPESLGFRMGPNIAQEELRHESERAKTAAFLDEEEEDDPRSDAKHAVFPISAAKLKFPVKLKFPASGIRIPGTGARAAVIAGLLALGVIGTLMYFGIQWYVPKVQVTIALVPKTVNVSGTIVIDPNATAADTDKKIIPGRKQEKVVTGEKTLAVTGKKKIGDPAKGTVVIYNKSTTSKTLKKGTVLSSGSLAFTLDADVTIASASENLVNGTTTYGKGNASVTASAIGPDGNLKSQSNFTFREYDQSVVSAVNEAAFTGGSSREVTVVSRADYDALTKELSSELLDKAKGDLASSVGGQEKLIDQTVKTAVTQKTFTEELDQEAKEVHGKLTVTVTGISYSEDDAKSLLSAIATRDIPPGYEVNESKSKTQISDVTVKKDGSLSVTASLALVAYPHVETEAVRGEIAGKSMAKAQESIRQLGGVSSAVFVFSPKSWNTAIPKNRKNITVVTQEEE